jgi:hypothetical protein
MACKTCTKKRKAEKTLTSNITQLIDKIKNDRIKKEDKNGKKKE